MNVADQIARAELDALRARGLFRSLEPLRSPPGAVIELAAGERLINFSSNDYLGLAGDPRIAAALAEGAQRWGAGAGASRLVTGDFLPQHELERELADYERAEAAVFFNSGYAANCALVPAFVGPEDLVVSDELNHASIIDACRLSRARVAIYRHLDVEHAAELLAKPARRKLLVTDAIFSMDGDRAPLRELAEACSRHGAILAVDEAHATGIFAEDEIEPIGELRMATHSKALGVAGAHVAASRAVCDLLINRARPLIFSTALPPAIACAVRKSLEIVRGPEGDERRARLWRNVGRFAEGLGGKARADSPIFPLLLGTPDRALTVAATLRKQGILAKAIRPPTVPPGTSRIRFAVTAAHTDDHIDAALDALNRSGATAAR